MMKDIIQLEYIKAMTHSTIAASFQCLVRFREPNAGSVRKEARSWYNTDLLQEQLR